MRLPVEWLHDYVRPDLTADALAERLAMTGTEVDRVLAHGVGSPDGFVVGRVLEAVQHPDADRLRVCRVDVGEAEAANIVCGAPNVAAGQTVAVARPGAVLPDGLKLKVVKLRGVRSEGMILAEDELAIGTDHDGIMVLSDELEPGTPLARALPIATEVLDLEITSNRPDCLGVYGVAREVHAATGAELAPPPWAQDPGAPGTAPEGLKVDVQCPELCPRFTVRLFEDVTVGPSPAWLKARLSAAGQRPISNVVDITNYAMLLTGHPLHAFDLDRVAGGRLVVRRARDGEEVETLDGQVRRLDPEMLLIADADGPTSIAGVMGGARSEVHEGTARVAMEAATWDGPNINRTSGRLALRSEASGRFEKGLQPEQALEAQAVATRLMVELCGARPVPGTIDVDASAPDTETSTLRLRDARVERLLGVPVAREEGARVLTALGFEVQDAEDGLDVTVPHWRRADVTREADLIEEVERLAVLERLPSTLPARRQARGGLSPRQVLRRRAADALAHRGLLEIAGWSFAAPALAARLRLEDARPVVLANPMSEEESVLRTTLLGSLLDVARRNVARGARELRLFELGTVYADTGGELADERLHLGGLLVGPVLPAGWRDADPRAAGFYGAKGIVEALLTELRADAGWQRASEPFLHPGRAANILLGGEPIGYVGELHPLVARSWDLEDVAVWELDLDRVPLAPLSHFADVTSFPALRRDLALSVRADVEAAQVLEAIRGAARLPVSADVFDVYSGAQAGEGRVSIAVRLEFRAPDRTLTDQEVDSEIDGVLAAVGELGAERRA